VSAARGGQPSVHREGPDKPALAAHRRQVAGRSASGTLRWILLSAAVVVLGVGTVLLLRPGESNTAAASATGTFTSERTSHDFGQVPMGGGLLLMRFPMAVQDDDALVSSILTS